MVNSIKTNSDGTVFTQGFGTLKKETVQKDNQNFYMNMPEADSNNSFALPSLLGVTRTIKLSGIFTTQDGTISTFLSELDSLANGNVNTFKYHSDKRNSDFFVSIDRVSYETQEAEVGMVSWDIDMTECAEVN